MFVIVITTGLGYRIIGVFNTSSAADNFIARYNLNRKECKIVQLEDISKLSG